MGWLSDKVKVFKLPELRIEMDFTELEKLAQWRI